MDCEYLDIYALLFELKACCCIEIPFISVDRVDILNANHYYFHLQQVSHPTPPGDGSQPAIFGLDTLVEEAFLCPK